MSENHITLNQEDTSLGTPMTIENTLNIQGMILNEEEPPKDALAGVIPETTYDTNRANDRRRTPDRDIRRDNRNDRIGGRGEERDRNREHRRRSNREREERDRKRSRERERRRSKEREREKKRREKEREGESFEELDDDDRKMMEELANPEKKKREDPTSLFNKTGGDDDDDDEAEEDDYPPDFARDRSGDKHRRHSGSPPRRPRMPSPSQAWSPRRDFEDDSKWGYNEPDMSPEEELKRKQELLEGFDKLSRKGIRIHRVFDINSDLREMEAEYNRLVKQREIENSIKFQRKMLLAFVTGVEFLNNRYNPFDLDIDGWSEVVMSDIDSYDDIFEELYEKYHTKVNMAPELRLMFTLGGSAIMFHLTNTMFKSALPGMDPGMAKGMQKMAMSAMRGGFGGGNKNAPAPFQSGYPAPRPNVAPPMASNAGRSGAMPMPPRNAGPPGMPHMPRPRPANSPSRRSTRRSEIPQPGVSTRRRSSPKRREMRGPRNADIGDILNDLNLPDEDIGTDIEALLNSDDSEETKHVSLSNKDGGITLKRN